METTIVQAPRARESGMTLVEVAISSALLVAVLLVAVTTTQTMSQMIRTGEAESGTVADGGRAEVGIVAGEDRKSSIGDANISAVCVCNRSSSSGNRATDRDVARTTEG
jgi:hypothetical protein